MVGMVGEVEMVGLVGLVGCHRPFELVSIFWKQRGVLCLMSKNL